MELRMCLLLEFKGFYAEILKTASPVLRVLCMALQWQTRFVTNFMHNFCGQIPSVICQFGLLVYRFQSLISII